jgi:hypothetical protein
MAMNSNWFPGDKEWLWGVVCSVAAGTFAVFKYLRPNKQLSSGSKKRDENTLTLTNGASINGPVAIGSGINQTLNAHVHLSSLLPISERKPTIPTANEIRTSEDNLPPYQQPQFLKNFKGQRVCWPVTFRNVYEPTFGEAEVIFRYGVEDYGAYIRTRVTLADYPVLKVAHDGRLAWIEGEISDIDAGFINIRKTRLEFENA